MGVSVCSGQEQYRTAILPEALLHGRRVRLPIAYLDLFASKCAEHAPSYCSK